MTRHTLFVLCSGAILAAVVAGSQKSEVKIGTGQSSSSFERIGRDSSHTDTDAGFPEESHNPDAKERERLRVLWGKASLGVYDIDVKRERFDLHWRDTEALLPHRQLAIKGKLVLASEDGKSSAPVDWTQGVRVVLSRKPKARPDWSKRHDAEDAAWSDCYVAKDGSFLARFDLGEIARPVGGAGEFQVALSLAVKSGRSVTWKNTDPVLSQSVATITIAGPQPLSPTMEAINGAPSVCAHNFNPVMLIRAVNHLHALGKDKALAELREFLKIARDSHNAERDAKNIDTSDHQCVFLIVRLLFEPAEPGESLPRMMIGAMIPSPEEQDQALWPLFPLVVKDDIPFMLIEGVNLAGHAEPPHRHVAWAEKHGKLRARPLRPGDDPLAAVDKLMALPQTGRLFGEKDRGVLRRQGWQMIDHLAQKPNGARDFLPQRGYDAKADWEEHKRAAAGLKIQWDEKRQTYAVSK